MKCFHVQKKSLPTTVRRWKQDYRNFDCEVSKLGVKKFEDNKHPIVEAESIQPGIDAAIWRVFLKLFLLKFPIYFQQTEHF